MLVFAVLAAGLSRLNLDADIFNLLPRDSRLVESLQAYQDSFGSSNELIVLLRSNNAEVTFDVVEQIVVDLESSGLTSQVIWRNPFQHNPEELGEFLAYLWFNQPPDEFAAMSRRFADDELEVTLERVLNRMTISLQPTEVARLGRDPFNLGEVAQRASIPIAGSQIDPFASSDGFTRILILVAPFESGGFHELKAWVSAVRDYLGAWQAETDPSLSIALTGNPAFVVESGARLLRDVQLAALGTLIIVAILFWMVYRCWWPLIWLIVLLTTVLSATAVAGGLVFGTLYAASLGFAAILLGLAADYGLVLYQETVAHPDHSAREHRAAVAPAILWSAVTTAGAFFMIGRSSLPGLTQLGVLVGIGILIAAVVMLLTYLPLSGARASLQATGERQPPKPLRLSSRTAIRLTVVVMAIATTVLLQRQPAVEYNTKSLQLSASSARSVLEEIRQEIGGFDDDLWLIVSGPDEAAVRNELDTASSLLQSAVADGVLAGYHLPDSLWPRPSAQVANVGTLAWLNDRWAAAETAANNLGFVDDSLVIDRAVFTAWASFDPAEGVIWPSGPGAHWVFRQFASRQEGALSALGRLDEAPHADREALLSLADSLNERGAGQLASWSLLTDSLLGVINRDINRVLIPIAVTLLVLLIAAFRGVGEVVLSIASIGLSLTLLLALMTVLHWSWNLINIMALPMLFGAGLDYSLHVQFALRRYAGDATAVRNNVGRAILLCAASTAAGFATLGFAGNAGLASLGRVCAAGVVITALVSVFLLPAWWRIMPLRRDIGEIAQT